MLNEQEIRALLRAECERAGSVAAWASSRGLADTYVSEVLRGLKAPGAKILAALGYRRVAMHARIEEGPHAP